MFERSGDYAAAAETYARAGASANAAAMYERSGQPRQAAELYLEVGEKARAAACFEHAQEHARAGRLYFELGRNQQALQLLQRVQPDHPDHLEAAHMIGELLARSGHRMVAIKRYIQMLRGNEIGDANASLFMHTADLLHAEGRVPQARAVYERIAAWRVDYREVQKKLQALGDPAATAPTPEVEEVAERAPLVSIMDGFEVIKDTPLFRELSLDEAREFYDRADRRTFAAGDVLIEQDQPGQGLLVIKSGAAKVLKVSSQGTTELARLGAGSPLGEMSLFDASPTSARVVADGAAEVFVLPRQRFEELVRSNDQLALKIYRVFIQILSDRLRKASDSR
jgi:tetratricopeptide (TPR) repeat protein